MPISVKSFLILFLLITEVKSQPDSRFRPFDWVLYKGSGEINSITEGYTFAYIATSEGGIKRFNLYGNYFDEPLTTAQGLQENSINAVHFDLVTGLIWAASQKYLQYSFSREGDWYSIDLQSFGLSRYDQIQKIGSSSNFIWLHARSSFVKIDHSSGMLIGIYPIPDELEIKWSSGPYRGETELRKLFENYNLLDGWIFNGNELIDRLGRRASIKTGFIGNHGNVFFGTNEGSLFYGTTTMESFSIMPDHVQNTDVSSLFYSENELYIGSQDFKQSKGISQFNLASSSSICYAFEETINMTPSPVHSLFHSKNELWAGGDGIILYHNQKDDYWRTLEQSMGVPQGQVHDIYGNDTHLWIGSSRGLGRMNNTTLREDPIGIENIFQNIAIHDIDSIEHRLWFGTRAGVFIYSSIQSQLMQMSDVGRKNFPEQLRNVVSLEQYGSSIYVVSDIGIIEFDIEEKEWNLIFTSGIYSNKDVYSMALNDKFIFLGVEDGLIKINKKTGLVRDYVFSFIGRVNEIILDGKEIWLGTSNGLIKFLWKRHL